MRVISGKARGTKLKTIDSIKTRPTLDRVKESLFNIIQNEIADKEVLDLFAGSGALGIEALSRNAKSATFCDMSNDDVKVLKENLENTHLINKAKIYNSDYKKCIKELKKENNKFDLIFIDPPYKMDLAVLSCEELIKSDVIKENCLIIIETDEITRDMDELIRLQNKLSTKSLQIVDKRKYGRANLIFIRITSLHYLEEIK